LKRSPTVINGVLLKHGEFWLAVRIANEFREKDIPNHNARKINRHEKKEKYYTCCNFPRGVETSLFQK